ncbi:hypothetical protein ACVWZM_002688 [Bradyrhizobium sp. USDA 4501]
MANKTKAENAAAAAAAAVERTAYSVPEFCAANDISEGLYRKLRGLGLAPRETRILRRVIITKEAADRWRAEREAASAVAKAETSAT